MSLLYTSPCLSSGMRIMMISAALAASAVEVTPSPSASARARDRLPSLSPTITSNPLSLRFRAWACPWLPYPMTAIFFPFKTSRFASLS